MAILLQNAGDLKAYRDFINECQNIYKITDDIVTRLTTDDLPANRIFSYRGSLTRHSQLLNTIITQNPGIVGVAQLAEQNPAYNLLTEYTALDAQVSQIINWINTSVPVDGDGYALIFQIDAVTGDLQPRMLPRTSPAVVAFVAELNALLALLDVGG